MRKYVLLVFCLLIFWGNNCLAIERQVEFMGEVKESKFYHVKKCDYISGSLKYKESVSKTGGKKEYELVELHFIAGSIDLSYKKGSIAPSNESGNVLVVDAAGIYFDLHLILNSCEGEVDGDQFVLDYSGDYLDEKLFIKGPLTYVERF